MASPGMMSPGKTAGGGIAFTVEESKGEESKYEESAQSVKSGKNGNEPSSTSSNKENPQSMKKSQSSGQVLVEDAQKSSKMESSKSAASLKDMGSTKSVSVKE
jgi:hypothetical protein